MWWHPHVSVEAATVEQTFVMTRSKCILVVHTHSQHVPWYAHTHQLHPYPISCADDQLRRESLQFSLQGDIYTLWIKLHAHPVLEVVLSWHGDGFCITGPLWVESTGNWRIPLKKASNAHLWYLICYYMCDRPCFLLVPSADPRPTHYADVIMSTMASQITSVLTVYWTVCSSPDQRKHQSSASLAFVRGIHRWPVNSPHKWPVTRKMFPFDDVVMLHKCEHR